MELINIKTSSTYSGIPKLAVYDDGSPMETSLICDYNKLIDGDLNSCRIEDLFSCDSVYDIYNDSVSIVFGEEGKLMAGKNKPTHRRFFLNIHNSKLSDFVDSVYTLYAVEID